MKTYYFEFFDLSLQVYFSRKIKTQCDGSYPTELDRDLAILSRSRSRPGFCF